MKRIFLLIIVLMTAMPAFAQDDGGGGGGAFAGGGGSNVFTRIDTVNPMEPVKAFLVSRVNITLSADQEKVLKPQVEAAFQQLRDLAAAQQGQRQGGQGGQGGGDRRGRGGRGGADPNSLTALAAGPAGAQIAKIQDDLMTKITAALKPDQQAAFKKYMNTEIKKAGGYGALKVNMEEAGAPLTAEQDPQIKAIYDDAAQQTAQLQRESQGHPDQAKLDDLQKNTMGKVVKLLTAAQRKALLDSRAKPAQ